MNANPLHLGCPHCGATNRLPAARIDEAPTCGRCGKELLQGQPLELTDGDFDAVVAATKLPVLVDFWAPWCGPCRMMAPAFEQAGRQLNGRALLVKVNSDDNPGLSARFGIRSIPTLVRLDGGRETGGQGGGGRGGASGTLAGARSPLSRRRVPARAVARVARTSPRSRRWPWRRGGRRPRVRRP